MKFFTSVSFNSDSARPVGSSVPAFGDALSQKTAFQLGLYAEGLG